MLISLSHASFSISIHWPPRKCDKLEITGHVNPGLKVFKYRGSLIVRTVATSKTVSKLSHRLDKGVFQLYEFNSTTNSVHCQLFVKLSLPSKKMVYIMKMYVEGDCRKYEDEYVYFWAPAPF